MPYVFEANAGVGNTSGSIRTVTAGFNGTDQLTFSGTIGGAVVGAVIQVRGAASGNGNYLITQVVTAGTVFRVQPTPPNLGGPGSATGIGIPRLAEAKVNAGAVTSYPATNQIRRTGALFVTRGVKRNDQVIIGPGTGTNQGIHVVASVIDEDNITVKTNTLSTAAPAGDTVSVVRCNNLVTITDEASANMAALISGATFFQPNWGPISDYINSLGIEGAGVDPGVGQAYTIDGRMEFRLMSSTGAVVTNFNITNEVWVNLRAGDQNIAGNLTNTCDFQAELLSGSLASPMLLNIGLRTGDELSGRSGSLLYGVSPGSVGIARWGADQFNVRMRASAVKVRRFGSNATLVIDGDSEMLTSLWAGQAFNWPALGVGSTGDLLVQATNVSTEQPPGIFASGADIRSIVIDSALSQFLASATDAQFANLAKSSLVPSPMYLGFSSPNAVFLDPEEDYALSTLFSDVFLSAGFRKSYTFNPRFVSRDNNGITGVPIPNLTVRLFRVNESTQVETEETGSPFTTDANGEIAAGAGTTVRRQQGADTFSTRMTVEGAGFRRIDQVLQVFRPFIGDVAVDYLQPDLEGETAT